MIPKKTKDEIKRLRKLGFTYKQISKLLGISVHMVFYYANDNRSNYLKLRYRNSKSKKYGINDFVFLRALLKYHLKKIKPEEYKFLVKSFEKYKVSEIDIGKIIEIIDKELGLK